MRGNTTAVNTGWQKEWLPSSAKRDQLKSYSGASAHAISMKQRQRDFDQKSSRFGKLQVKMLKETLLQPHDISWQDGDCRRLRILHHLVCSGSLNQYYRIICTIGSASSDGYGTQHVKPVAVGILAGLLHLA